MFKCGNCGKITEPREKLTKKVVLVRDRIYDTSFEIKGKTYYRSSFGTEIVKEINLCEDCASKEK